MLRCLEDENIFSSKKHSFFFLLNFSNFQNFLIFLRKKPYNRVKTTFSRNNTIWYAFHSKFATFSVFEKKFKIFSKNPSVFFLKPQILNVLRNLTISIAFYGKFATIWWKKIDIQTREQPMLARLRELNWWTSGKKTQLFERKILLSIFSVWRKIVRKWKSFMPKRYLLNPAKHPTRMLSLSSYYAKKNLQKC